MGRHPVHEAVIIALVSSVVCYQVRPLDPGGPPASTAILSEAC